ncbi:MAG: thioredoxin family protein [Acidobacteria bacterium]|nr:MAG: thioredoxin family protein [Acidobacteriota bacterium]
MKIQILGTGCAKCNKLADLASKAAAELQLDCELEKVTDINDILSYGVMVTPALAVDGKVVSAGKLPGFSEIKDLLTR